MRDIKDIEVFEQTPWQDRCLGETTYDLFCRSAELFADSPALKFQFTASVDERPLVICYRELLQKINQAANAIHSAGVTTGGVTSIILPNLPQTHYTLWGGQALGIAGPINPMLEPLALRDIMRESGTEALVVLGPAAGSDLWEKAVSIVDQVPSLKIIFQVNLVADPDRQVSGSGNPSHTPGGTPILDFDTQLKQQTADKLCFERDSGPEKTSAYLHTGGTTGTPKLAQISNKNQVFMASIFSNMFAYDENTVALCGLPLFHANAIFVTGLNVLACGGQTVYLTSGGYRTPGVIDKLWLFVEKYQATFFSAVPTIITSLLNNAPGDPSLIRSMKHIVCGAAPISRATLQQFSKRTGITILEGYGMTESSCIAAVNPEHGEQRVGSVGLRIPYQGMRCVQLDSSGSYLRDCAVGEQGTIVIKGPNVFKGYKQANENEGLFVDGGWLVTGDLAWQDRDGYFWLTGRSKDLIIRGGHNIDPKAIEDVLSNHSEVDLVAAIGQPDAYAGELPCAYVTVSQNGGVNEEELMNYARQHIPEKAAIPVHLEIISEMPLTAVGKIYKPTLSNRAIERVLNTAIVNAGLSAEVIVENDDKKGVVATVNGTSDKPAIKELLDQFTIAYQLGDERSQL